MLQRKAEGGRSNVDMEEGGGADVHAQKRRERHGGDRETEAGMAQGGQGSERGWLLDEL